MLPILGKLVSEIMCRLLCLLAQLPCYFGLFACIIGVGCTIRRLTATHHIMTVIEAHLDRASVVSATLVTHAS